MARILIAVTHLLGSGHLVRAGHLARALAQAGHEVALASGGMKLRLAPNEPFALLQLPPVRVEGVDFASLLDEAGAPIDQRRRDERIGQLTALATAFRPDLVITEHFPFGRRQLADEFLALLAAAKAANPNVLALSSVRDVLVTPRADKIEQAHARLAAHFDGVLVHGDRSFLPLEASWPVAPELAERLHYTGYLDQPDGGAPAGQPTHKGDLGEILVSGGGSGAALPLFRLCLEAAQLLPPRPWRLLAGRGLAPDAFSELQRNAPEHVIVEWARPDFPALLAACALSISQAGYNTVLDLLRAGRPAIIIPFDAGNETEQGVRAQAMAQAGLAACLRLEGLSGAGLAEAVTRQLAVRPQPVTIDRNGAAGTVEIVARLLSRRGPGGGAGRLR